MDIVASENLRTENEMIQLADATLCSVYQLSTFTLCSGLPIKNGSKTPILWPSPVGTASPQTLQCWGAPPGTPDASVPSQDPAGPDLPHTTTRFSYRTQASSPFMSPSREMAVKELP